MSSRCQCPFSGPADTILGSHRDPISSEKSWLDYAVRELSRVAAGKARGQEAVWRSQCKPDWWDSECRFPWKNPTANPKDSKDTLKKKFECLVQHLRKNGQLPDEMKTEISLWESGKVSEVYLLTSFSSLLRQASNLHSVIVDVSQKMKESGISVAPAILTDLHHCLSASVDKINTIKNSNESHNSELSKGTSSSGLKRLHSETDSDSDTLSQQFGKRFKTSSDYSSLSSSLPSATSSPSVFLLQSSQPALPVSVQPTIPVSNQAFKINPEQQKTLLATLKQQITDKMLTVSTAATVSFPQISDRPAQVKSGTCAVRSKPKLKKREVLKQNVASTVNASPSTCLSAIAGESELNASENFETVSIPGIDLLDCDDIDLDFWNNDSDFGDQLLEGNHSKVTETVDNNAISPTLKEIAPDMPKFLSETSNCINHDPLLCHTTVTAFQTDLFQFGNSTETKADSQVVGEARNMEEDSITALCLDVRDGAMHETDIACESGYSSESSVSTSVRSSLDSDNYSHSDLNSPDLEAYLDSL